MPRWLRIVFIIGALLIAVVLGGWYWAWSREVVPETTSYVLDITEMRRLARSLPGERPMRINHEQVQVGALPLGAVFAWKSISEMLPFTHGAYQVVYSDGFGVIDSAYEEAAAEEMAQGQPVEFSRPAFEAIQRSLSLAKWIVITHEHSDHMGGIAAYETPIDLVGRLFLTPEQLDNVASVSAIPQLAPALRESLEPLAYDNYHALAPGVVLIKAPGHTVGSQMVFVQLSDDREVLLLGDVAWQHEQIVQLWYRPRLITNLLLRENRSQVMAQFRALHELMKAEPKLTLLVSHDVAQRQRLLASGLLGEHFELP